MSDELDDIVENLREPSAWFRVIFMLAFAIILYVIIAPVILVLMTAQALFSVITGSDNSNLRSLGAALNEYVGQILAFLSYNSEIKPFPFSDFPATVNSDSDESSEPSSAAPVVETVVAEEKKVVKKKPAANKKATASTAKKKTAKKVAKKTAKAAPSDTSDADASN